MTQPINITWNDDDRTIILIEYLEPWTWDDFHSQFQKVVTMINTVPHSVYLIHDVHHNIRSRTSPAPHIRTLFNNPPENMAAIYIAIYTTYIRRLAEISVKIAAGRNETLQKITFVDHIETARALVSTAQEHARSDLLPEME